MNKFKWTVIPGGRIKKARTPTKVAFEPILPLALKDTVKGTITVTKSTPCVNELIEMMDCLKRTGFTDKPCTASITAYATCVKVSGEKAQLKQERAQEDMSYVTNPREFGRAEMRKLLKNFPIK